MGEITTPGCFDGSSGAATGCGAGAAAARGGAGAGAAALRATRTRWPSCSISISVRPVSSNSLVSSRMSSRLTTDVFGDFAIKLFFRLFDFFGADHTGQPGDRQRIAVGAESGHHGFRRLR